MFSCCRSIFQHSTYLESGIFDLFTLFDFSPLKRQWYTWRLLKYLFIKMYEGASRMTLLKEIDVADWGFTHSTQTQSEAIHALENGRILYFPTLAFDLLPPEKKFLTDDFALLKAKNISFDIKTGRLRGMQTLREDEVFLNAMMRRYALSCLALMKQLLPRYHDSLEIGRTSFRPIEIEGRKPKSYRKDDTRLHVDSFPSTPTQGKRLLRVFCNINPHHSPRLWHVGEPFEKVAKQFLPKIKRPWPLRAPLLNMLGITRSMSTEYDYLMLQIHNQMKADLTYQKSVPFTKIAFAPGTSWMVQTDHVSHAALKGQHLLEQTFYLPHLAMEEPSLSPLGILEKLTGRKLI